MKPALIAFLLLAGTAFSQTPPQRISVTTIAPSVSTSMEARKIRADRGMTEVDFKSAQAILVVVRSGLFNPLEYSYGSFKELEEDADNQLNIAGKDFHIYLYTFDSRGRCSQAKHIHYEANPL